jgi:hypothetical protein
MTFAGDTNEAQSEGQGFSPFSILQSYAVCARNVENLELHDVRVDFARDDLRPALFGEGIGVLDLDRFKAERAPNGSPSMQFAGIKRLLMMGRRRLRPRSKLIILRYWTKLCPPAGLFE